MTSDRNLSRELRIQQLHAELQARNGFWPWFWRAGVVSFLDRWLVMHVVAGAALAFATTGKLSDIAVPASVPFAAILVGLAVAWSGNASALLQSLELQRIGAGEDGRATLFRAWVFQYQAAVLGILACTTAWALAAAGIFNNRLVAWLPWWVRMAGRAALFCFSCITVRECWQVVGAVQMKLLGQLELKRQERLIAASRAEDAKKLAEKSQ
ncbi:hypothetical protein [Sorangium sp. So ce1078]|uniref:hypothetical protein n=1 Tax=Sorangium sp. So ce1078 TaxID=3133329 RepID=UPI003F5EF314